MSELGDCVLCNVPSLLTNKTPVWLITNKTILLSTSSLYESYNYTKPITNNDFKTNVNFTPKARYTLTIEQSNELLTHSKIWNEFLVTKKNHAIIFTDESLLSNIDVAHRLENLVLPKDWDIIMLPNGNYVLTNRAANILLASCRQFNNPLNTYIQSIPGLRIVSANLNLFT